MLKRLQGIFAALGGPSNNDRYAELLAKVSRIAIDCARHLHKTAGQELEGIVDFEHAADRVTDEIHELLDKSFIMRFDIPDSMRLADELDNVVDGMRKVALHVDAYKPFLTTMRPEALELMVLIETMLVELDALVAMLGEPRLVLARVREVARRIDEKEAKADKIVAEHERRLVAEFTGPGSIVLGFIAWHQLLHLLERITDNANHCASLILSLARKEA